MKVAVVGGGIAGLSAAWELVAGPVTAEVTVFDPDPSGGKIVTADFCGRPVDTGPDAFIARMPEGIALCRELGIESELVAPQADRALLWSADRLRPMPAGLMLGVPGRLWPLLTSGIVSAPGLLRASLDLVLPATRWSGDVAVAELVSRRFGRQVAERLVDPLLGGIHAGSTDRLSVEATAAQLAQAARAHRSLLIGLKRTPPPAPGPLFLAPRRGMGRLVERLVEALQEKGVNFVRAKVTGLKGQDQAGVTLEPGGSFGGVVVATPAAEAAGLLRRPCPGAAADLATIRTASVTLVTFAYQASALRIPAGSSGLLVPRGEGLLMTACSFGSAKWPHWSGPDRVILRVSAGRDGDERAVQLDDESLVERLHAEIARTLSATERPRAWRVSRWPAAFPQYDVGHLARVERIEHQLTAQLPEVALAGASYRGSGIPACIASGRRAAATVAARG